MGWDSNKYRAHHEKAAEGRQADKKRQGRRTAAAREAVWTTKYINDLPDGAFLYIKPGGKKDNEGKTVPRALRMFPYKDAGGKVDLPHLRNAIARIPQAVGIPAVWKTSLQNRARAMLEKARA